ncbi:MAG: transposase [Salinivirgaceae bacterium]|nr:transposase [Salinivirgaceae bacterium]MBR5167524.1 transposase [Salinivirgaceae bacterium]
MPQSLSKIYLHIVFHIKTTSPQIDEAHLERVHSYIGQLVNSTGCSVIRVGGIGDHVHVLCLLSRNETVSHLVEEIKRNSSRWIKTLGQEYECFAWQGGYAVFSVSESLINKTIEYVINQKEHHKKLSFKEEYIQFLKLYNIDYDERYVFED